MRLAICSDIHDNIWKLERALPMMAEAGVLICCGDFCAPFTLAQLAAGFAGPVHAVMGNNDGDPILLERIARKAGNATLHGQFAELEFGSLRVFVNHYPEIGRAVAQGGVYGLVCYGHDHRLHHEMVGDTALLNPGEIMGRFGRSTFAFFDTESRQVTVINVE